MSPGSRITIRLTEALEALVSDRVRQGSHVSDIVREALAVYLGACLPTRPTPHASVLTSAAPVSDSVAALVSDIVSAKVSDVLSDISASVSDMSDMRTRLEQLEARLEELSARVSQRPTPRLTSQPRTPAAAPEAGPPRRRGGRPPSRERQQILMLLEAHPDGLSAEELRVYVKPAKPLGDTLQGMRKTGVLRVRHDGKTLRYVLA